MCTVSIIRLSSEVIRIACNRDELLSRPTARPPEVRCYGNYRAAMPLDPQGGGTWIAASDAGIVMTLLNVNTPRSKHISVPYSRGHIIPSLLNYGSVEEIIDAAAEIRAGEYGQFRLIAIDSTNVAEAVSDGSDIQIAQHTLGENGLLFTSSGLGDDLVQGPRRSLFEKMLRTYNVDAATQDGFHGHHWPDRPYLSVCMKRADAKTVSHTIAEIRPDRISVKYHPAAPDERATDHFIEFPTQAMALV